MEPAQKTLTMSLVPPLPSGTGWKSSALLFCPLPNSWEEPHGEWRSGLLQYSLLWSYKTTQRKHNKHHNVLECACMNVKVHQSLWVSSQDPKYMWVNKQRGRHKLGIDRSTMELITVLKTSLDSVVPLPTAVRPLCMLHHIWTRLSSSRGITFYCVA